MFIFTSGFYIMAFLIVIDGLHGLNLLLLSFLHIYILNFSYCDVNLSFLLNISDLEWGHVWKMLSSVSLQHIDLQRTLKGLILFILSPYYGSELLLLLLSWNLPSYFGEGMCMIFKLLHLILINFNHMNQRTFY